MTNEIVVRDMNAALERPKAVEELLASRAEELDVLLRGSTVTRDQFIRGVVLGLASAEPKLLQASRNSILLSCLAAAEMGLVPSGQHGGAYLVKYGNDAQLIVDWRGLIKLALRSGQVRKVEADNVYENDAFDYERGTEEFIRHRPVLDGVRGAWTHTYAIATLADGTKQFEVMSAAQIDAIRGNRKGPWVDHPEEMRRKTAVKRLFKYIPQAVTPQLARALEYDNEESWDQTEAPMPARRRSLAQAIVEGDVSTVDATQVTAGPMIDGQPVDSDEGLPA